MWKIRKTFTFDSAHYLPDHEGKCRELHGHTYILTVELKSDRLFLEGSNKGMVEDFSEIKKYAGMVIDGFDHHCLNDFMTNPTAEEMARYFYDELSRVWGTNLSAIEISETPTSMVRYEG